MTTVDYAVAMKVIFEDMTEVAVAEFFIEHYKYLDEAGYNEVDNNGFVEQALYTVMENIFLEPFKAILSDDNDTYFSHFESGDTSTEFTLVFYDWDEDNERYEVFIDTDYNFEYGGFVDWKTINFDRNGDTVELNA